MSGGLPGVRVFALGAVLSVFFPGAASLAQVGTPPRPSAQARALEALLVNRAAARSLLSQRAVSGTRSEKRFAVQALGFMRERGAVGSLLVATRDDDADVRKLAVIALRKIGDPGAAPRLREILAARPEAALAKASLAALGKLGDGDDRALLRSYLSASDEGVRVHAAGALGMLGSDEGLQALLKAIDGDNPVAQKNATYALGFIPDPRARERLDEILADEDGRWKSYALMALAERDIAGAAPAQQASYLGALAERRDRVVSAWCLERLAELDTAEADAEIARLSTAGDRLGAMARMRLRLEGEN